MSGSLHGWYSLRDLESLGVRGAGLSGDLQLGSLPRLLGMLSTDDGSVRATASFEHRRDGWLTVELTYEADLEWLCQRCLEPERRRMSGRVSLAVLDSVPAGSQVPEGFEPVELERGRLSPAQLVEDELIVSLPLVPKHARIEDCGSLTRTLARLSEADDAANEATDR